MALPRVEDVTVQAYPLTCRDDDCTATATHWLVASDGTTSCAYCAAHTDAFLADCERAARDLTMRGESADAVVGWYGSPIEYANEVTR